MGLGGEVHRCVNIVLAKYVVDKFAVADVSTDENILPWRDTAGIHVSFVANGCKSVVIHNFGGTRVQDV